MSEQAAPKQRFMVSVYEPDEEGGAFIFTFMPKGLQQERGPGGSPKRVPQFNVAVRQAEGGLRLDWSASDDPDEFREEMETHPYPRQPPRAIAGVGRRRTSPCPRRQ